MRPGGADAGIREILCLQTARLGDLVQTIPLLRGLRRSHPEARLTLVAQPGPSTLFEGSGLCDRLIAVPGDAIDSLADPARGEAFPDIAPFASEPAFRAEYDLLVNVSNDLGAAALCRGIHARHKLGRIHTYAGELRLLGPWSKYLYAMVAHRRENLFNLVDIQTGMAGLTPRPEAVPLPAPESRRAEARSLLAAAGIGLGRKSASDADGTWPEILQGRSAAGGTGAAGPSSFPEKSSTPGQAIAAARPLDGGRPLVSGRPLVGLQAGASSLHRAWSLDHFAALGAGLIRAVGAELVLLGDERERERCAELAARIGGEGVANLAGRTTLPQMHAILSQCDLLVSNDTGSIHVAAAAGTTTLGLYFSTAYFAETAPYGAGHAVLQTEIPCAPCDASNICAVQKCRDYLPPARVLEAALWLLAGAPPDAAPAAAPNLSLYRSRFLQDGSLAYLPVRPEAASDHFQGALLGRMLWQEALGLSGDPVLDALCLRLRKEAPFRHKREELAAALADLEKPVRRGLELAAGLRAEFQSPSPERERILAGHARLAELASALAAAGKPAGLCGTFLHFELMDMDYVAYPMLAGILEGKYRQLADRIARFRAALERMA